MYVLLIYCKILIFRFFFYKTEIYLLLCIAKIKFFLDTKGVDTRFLALRVHFHKFVNGFIKLIFTYSWSTESVQPGLSIDQELIHFAHTAIQRGNFSEDRCRRDVSTFLTGEILILSHVLHIVKKKVFSFWFSPFFLVVTDRQRPLYSCASRFFKHTQDGIIWVVIGYLFPLH